MAAAQAGRHLFIEKPIALSAVEGQAIVEAGQKAGVRIMVGYMKRYDASVERMAHELQGLTPLRFARSTTAEFPLKWYVAHYPVVRGTDIDAGTATRLQADDEARVTAAITHPAWHSGTWIKGRLADQAAVFWRLQRTRSADPTVHGLRIACPVRQRGRSPHGFLSASRCD